MVAMGLRSHVWAAAGGLALGQDLAAARDPRKHLAAAVGVGLSLPLSATSAVEVNWALAHLLPAGDARDALAARFRVDLAM